jgi:hypothetical protein
MNQLHESGGLHGNSLETARGLQEHPYFLFFIFSSGCNQMREIDEYINRLACLHGYAA